MKMRVLLFGAFLVPLSDPSLFNKIEFGKIPTHQVQHQADGLSISVQKSASPLIYRFPEMQRVSSLRVEAVLVGSPPRLASHREGHQEGDDFALRVGLIVQGRQRLNWLQRQIAPSWLKKLEALLPPSEGVAKVHFLTTCQSRERLQKPIPHALDGHLIEHCVLLQSSPGDFQLQHAWESPIPSLGLWIGPDGDNSQSEFKVLIKKIEINGK